MAFAAAAKGAPAYPDTEATVENVRAARRFFERFRSASIVLETNSVT